MTRHQTVWNFCACVSDVTWWGNQWWRRAMTAVFSGCTEIDQPSDLYRSSKESEVWFSHLILHSHLAVPAQSSFARGFCQPRTGLYFVPHFVVHPIFNRSFLSSKNFHFENECESEFFCMTIKISFITMASHSASALKKRLEATRKWPIFSSHALLGDL